MESFQLFGYAGALVLGIIMGTTGSGGSAMAVPMFNYLFLLDMHTATAHALFVVGISAMVGVLLNMGRQRVEWYLSLLFAIPMMFTVFGVRRFLLPLIPEVIFEWKAHGLFIDKDLAIMLLFGLLMALSAILAIKEHGGRSKFGKETGNRILPIPLFGIGIGILTGITGTGGGLLIVPVLLVFLKMPFKKAIATSLLIIALKSFTGFMGDLGQVEFDWLLLFSFTALSLTGMFLGVQCSHRLAEKNLKKGFGYMVLVISLFVFYKELSGLV